MLSMETVIMDTPDELKRVYLFSKPNINIENHFEINQDIKDEEIVKSIMEFYTKMKQDEYFDDKYFIKNVAKLILEKKEFGKLEIANTLAVYNTVENIIEYVPEEYRLAIMHELLHLASSYYDKQYKIAYSGFCQTIENFSTIGTGLNEAYTNILDARYFKNYAENKEEFLNNTYKIPTELVSILENLLSSPTMEKYYFDADLVGLYKELCEYSNSVDTMTFILNLDEIVYLSREMEQCDTTKLNKRFCRLFNDCIAYLVTINLNAIEDAHIKGIINDEEYLHDLEYTKKIAKMSVTTGFYKIVKSRPMSNFKFNHIHKQEKKKVLKENMLK